MKALKNGRFAKFGSFGFDPELPEPKAYPEAISAIRRLNPGSPILFGPSSFIASISPCLAVRGITDELEKRSDCPKILFLNLTLNNETIGMSVSDFLEFWALNTGKPVCKTLNFVVVNNDLESTPEIASSLKDRGDSLETFKFRGPLTLTDREKVSLAEKQGIILVEAPLSTVTRQLMRLSSTGEREHVWVPNHNSKRLMSIAKSLTDLFLSVQTRKFESRQKNTASSIQIIRVEDDPAFECILHGLN